MEKLFFTTLLATVVVGGAFAQGYYSQGSDTRDIFCEGSTISCFVIYGEYIAYTVPFYTGLQGQPDTIVDLSILDYDF